MPYSFGGNNYKQQQFLANALMQSSQNNASPLASGLGAFAGALLSGKAADTQENDNKQLAEMLMGAKTPEDRARVAINSSDPRMQQAGMAALLSNKGNQPLSGVGKIQADLAAGLLTPQQAQAAMNKATTVAPTFGMISPYQERQLGLQERKIAAQEKKVTTGTALPRPVVNDLMTKATTIDGYERLISKFNDDYAGQPLGIGRARNLQGRTFGDNGQAQWWQDYDSQANVVRNELFGSALSAGEQAAWEQAAINPGMKPSQIKQNIARQNEIVRTGLGRLADTYRAGGYNQNQINIIMKGVMSGKSGAPQDGTIDATVNNQGGGNVLPQRQPGQSLSEAAAGAENIPNGGNIQPSSQVPAGAIQHLRQNPGLSAAFEAKYGVPAAQYLQ